MPITPKRDIAKEKIWVDEFFNTKGRKPESAQDWAWVQKQAYGDSLPAEFADNQSELERMSGTTAPTTAPTSLEAQLQAKGAERDVARAGLQVSQAQAQLEQRTTPEALKVYQEALRKKIKAQPSVAEQVYKGAGLKGYGSVMGAIQAKRSEIGSRYDNFRSLFNEMKGEMHLHNRELLGAAELSLKNYEQINEEYGQIFNRMNELEDMEREEDEKRSLMEREYELKKDYFKFQQGYKEPTGVAKKEEQAYKAGLLADKADGMSYDDAVTNYGSVLPLSFIRETYYGATEKPAEEPTKEEQFEELFYGKQLEDEKWRQKVIDEPKKYRIKGDKVYEIVKWGKDELVHTLTKE